jgi:hypothetical protein
MPSFVVDTFSLPNSGLPNFGASWLRLISIYSYLITSLLLFINLYIYADLQNSRHPKWNNLAWVLKITSSQGQLC